VFPFAFDRRKIAQAEWRHEGILEAFDEVKSGHARLALRSEAAPIDQLVFEGGEKNFRASNCRRRCRPSLSMDQRRPPGSERRRRPTCLRVALSFSGLQPGQPPSSAAL
jgi:hypothetical protein